MRKGSDRKSDAHAKTLRVYDRMIGNEIERELAQRARSAPKPRSIQSPAPVAPERDPFEIARAVGCALKGAA